MVHDGDVGISTDVIKGQQHRHEVFLLPIFFSIFKEQHNEANETGYSFKLQFFAFLKLHLVHDHEWHFLEIAISPQSRHGRTQTP